MTENPFCMQQQASKQFCVPLYWIFREKKFAGLQNHGQRIGKLEKINKCKKLLLTRLNLILRFEVLKLPDCHHFHTPYFREINFSVKSHGNVRMSFILCSVLDQLQNMQHKQGRQTSREGFWGARSSVLRFIKKLGTI